MQAARKHVHHHLAFVEAQQAVVDKDTGELVSDGAVNQGRGHAGIYPAREPENDFLAAHLLANASHGFFDVVAHDPVGAGFADVEHKALQ